MPQENTQKGSEPKSCKYCQSERIKKYGKVKDIQRYFCNDCRRKFACTYTIPKMQTPTEYIADALNMHYEGMSLNEIRGAFIQQRGKCISKVTLYNWGKRFSKLAKRETEKYTPRIGYAWEVYETVIHKYYCNRKKQFWIIDILDKDTRFLISTRLSYNHNGNNVRKAMEHAREVAGGTPKKILTDGWNGYLYGIELAFGPESKHIQTTLFADKNESADMVERWKETLKERIKVMHRLKTFESMNEFLQNWCIYYNFLRPNLPLSDKSPAQMADIDFPYHNWKELIEKQPY